MNDSARQQHARLRRRGRRVKWGVAAATLAIAATFAAIALASGSTSVDSASSATLGESVLVGSSGHTLYELSPETTSHLLCKSSECLKFWPPLSASSASKVKLGAGVHGKVGILHRSNGISQVTLNGHPLYFFAEDKARGEVNGQNFKGFGGTWHVLSDSGQPSSKAPGSSTAPAASAPAPAAPTGSSSSEGSGSNNYSY
jgi:predicted lipoprotein with Yx(FWY)xxD motif